MELKLSILGLVTVLCAVTGCFREPVPAYTQVAPENRVYLKEQGLTVLTAEDILSKGRVFTVSCGLEEEISKGAASKGVWTNLSALVTSLVPANLDYLNLDRNALTDVSVLPSFTGLKWLRLNGNRLTDLPDLKALAALRRIYLSNNQLSSVPETLKDLPALTDIDLSGNPIKSVPSWLAEKKGLQNLSLSRTQITELPKDLSAWSCLVMLQLGELKLSAEEMARIRRTLPDVRIVF